MRLNFGQLGITLEPGIAKALKKIPYLFPKSTDISRTFL